MTARYAVIGDPIAHSLSPTIQQAAFDALGIDARYEARRTTLADLPDVIGDVRVGTLHGVNVTMPLKSLAHALVDRVEGGGRRAGSVNTLIRESDLVVGYSSDIPAIQQEWVRHDLPTGSVLLLGAGGAAAAALVALEGWHVYASARSPGRLETLAAALEMSLEIIPWGSPVPGAVVVNSTPIGMQGESLPPTVLAEADGLFDMPYGKLPTPAVTTAKTLSMPVVDGLDMLVAQAAVSCELWTGHRPSLSVMRNAAQIAQGW